MECPSCGNANSGWQTILRATVDRRCRSVVAPADAKIRVAIVTAATVALL